jgi:phenylacetate-CoA ligase
MIWSTRFECMSRSDMEALQSERLASLVRKVYENVPFYRAKMDAAGVRPGDIRGIRDLGRLPFTTKTEMREVYPYGLLATEKRNIVEIHTSSGTTGKPVVDAYTAGDIDIWSEVMARALASAGVTSSDTIQNAYGYGLFTGGLGVHHGARRLGAAVIPISGGNTQRQLMILKDFGPEVLTCTPSYCLYLAEGAREQGLDIATLPLRVGVFGAEPWSDRMRDEIEARLRILALDIYGLTEIIGPGVSQECPEKCGLHVAEDHFLPEIVDPETGAQLPPGSKGELVFTTISKEGTPVIRYRTRDITFLDPAPCRCGRSTVRMHRLLGRTDDMLIIRGVNVFPSQIEEVLLRVQGIEPQYQLVVDRAAHLDTLEVQVEMNERMFSDQIRNLESLERDLSLKLQGALGIHASVKLVEPKSIPRSEGKAKRIVDRRKI